MTPAQTTRIMAILSDVFDKPVSKGLLTAYVEALGDLDHEDVSRAVRDHIASSKWFPKPAEIRERIANYRVDAPEEYAAWGQVIRRVRVYGRHRQVEALESMNPLVRRAVEAVGWQAICDSTLQAAERKAFLGAYTAIRGRSVLDEQMPSDRTLEAPKVAKQLGEALKK